MTLAPRTGIEASCPHRWDDGPESNRWGIIIGLSRCLDCGARSREADFLPRRAVVHGLAEDYRMKRAGEE